MLSDNKERKRLTGVAAYRKGYRYERKLVQYLLKHGCYAVRVARSGRTTGGIVYPDVLAICGSAILLFEVKYRSKEKVIYIKKEQAKRLVEISKEYNFIPLICTFTSKSQAPLCCFLSSCLEGAGETLACDVEEDCKELEIRWWPDENLPT